MLRIHFETPVHGWILVTFESGEQTLKIDVSHIPTDALLVFVERPLSFANWGEGSGYFGHGSSIYGIVLRHEGKEAILEVFEMPYHSDPMPGQGTLIFTVQDTSHAVLLAFWRGLRNLQSRFDVGHWHYAFPTEAVEKLGVIVKG